LAQEQGQTQSYFVPLKRMFLGGVVLAFLGIFIFWRIDSPRVERFRAQIVDAVIPSLSWAMVPMTALSQLVSDFQSYQSMWDQNQQLRRELRLMSRWKEAAYQLEQENARLRDLNNVRLDPQLTYITGVVLADSGSPFRQTVLVNVGSNDGIVDGWAAMDGIGLVGRVSGVGRNTSRVVLLTDATSKIPAVITASDQRALVVGDNTIAPPIDFVENPDFVAPGDQIVTSGDGDVFPPGLLIGSVSEDANGRLRVRLAADYQRLEFLRIIRDHGTRRVRQLPGLVIPEDDVPETVAPNDGSIDG
jgi:rod shape-determining protein MreC